MERIFPGTTDSAADHKHIIDLWGFGYNTWDIALVMKGRTAAWTEATVADVVDTHVRAKGMKRRLAERGRSRGL